ncbi:MAG TPA: magnesium chelatase, partial [Salinimicrobium catena]|nr:magnesium chelatase [Salinimicrobium catena]
MENEEIKNDEISFENRIPLEELKSAVEHLKSQLSGII